MKFETILDMYDMANDGTWMEVDDEYKRRVRQRDAFRARLVAMYCQERDDAELYRTLADPLPDEYWLSEKMEYDPLLGMEEQDG